MNPFRGHRCAAVGCDVVSVQRIAENLERHPRFRTRVFTPRELVDARRGGVQEGAVVEHERLAARFAAKEAARKALGDLSLGFHDTEIRTEASGAPSLYVRGERSPLQLSLSHDGGIAFAVVTGGTRCNHLRGAIRAVRPRVVGPGHTPRGLARFWARMTFTPPVGSGRFVSVGRSTE